MRFFATVFGAFLLLFPGLLAAQEPDASWVTPGSPTEDRLRIRQLLGTEPTAGFLLRTPSVLSTLQTGSGYPWPLSADSGDTIHFAVLPPEIVAVWNSDLPFSFNDGPLWAGRGANTLVRAGVAVEFKALRIVLAPEFVYSQNEPFQTFPGREQGRSPWSSPWYTGRQSADLPLRFGDESVLLFAPGQSSVTVTTRPVAFGASSENMWWGPGIRTGLVMSGHAQGIPHLFVRTAGPVDTRAGSFEARLVIGGLTESLYFDTIPGNDVRSLSGLVVTYTPSSESGLTLGLSRTVVMPTGGEGEVLGHLFNVFTEWDRQPGSPGADSVAGSDQILALFGRWTFPESGFEVFGEWARMDLPGSLEEMLVTPHHSQAYTLGLQWVSEIERGDLLRVQSEVSYLEQTQVLEDRPLDSYYTGRAAEQGYTQRGQVIGASTGPGSSSQWLAVDYLADRWSVGGFAGRIRWSNEALYRQPGANWLRHDVSLLGGVRGGVDTAWGQLTSEITISRRRNYLFQRGGAAPQGIREVDIGNLTVELGVRPRLP